MTKPLTRGERIAWRSSRGERVGRVERKTTSPSAEHKPSALRRVQ
jgi:hypothetical protein